MAHGYKEIIFGSEYTRFFKDETVMALIFQYPIPLMLELIKLGGNSELILFEVKSTVGLGNGCISFRNY